MAQWVEKLPIRQETQEMWVQSLDWEDPLEKENGNPFQHSCLKNPMDRGVCWATVYGVAESDTSEQLMLSLSLSLYLSFIYL